ncbi:hypothetical protein M011DRAFT_499842 [Sporormia fimetaria CBS 119925]|uniref:Uncharacterized protein n=1 Tax=Sporormia fimetaria CBS 119925 TaxID=1340428 RepID=A0A6A6VBA5_9PLEO|nr:hypothetical protein M011DRAFT_499842 [Sporormia fimetaria CBS 119925]
MRSLGVGAKLALPLLASGQQLHPLSSTLPPNPGHPRSPCCVSTICPSSLFCTCRRRLVGKWLSTLVAGLYGRPVAAPGSSPFPDCGSTFTARAYEMPQKKRHEMRPSGRRVKGVQPTRRPIICLPPAQPALGLSFDISDSNNTKLLHQPPRQPRATTNAPSLVSDFDTVFSLRRRRPLATAVNTQYERTIVGKRPMLLSLISRRFRHLQCASVRPLVLHICSIQTGCLRQLLHPAAPSWTRHRRRPRAAVLAPILAGHHLPHDWETNQKFHGPLHKNQRACRHRN